MGMILTQAGQNALNELIAGDAPLVITEMSLGSEDREPTGGETALGQELIRVPVLNKTHNNGLVRFDAQLGKDVGPFTIYELGLHDVDGTLIAIGRAEGIPKLVGDDDTIHTMDISASLLLSSLQNVVVQIDGNFAFVPQSRVLTTGNGLTGGGDFSADRTIELDFATDDEGFDGVDSEKPISPAVLKHVLDENNLTAGTLDPERLPNKLGSGQAFIENDEIVWEDGVNRITHNDGAGNVQIRFGHEAVGGVAKFTHDGTAFYIGGELDAPNGGLTIRVAANGGAGTGETVQWGETFGVRESDLLFAGTSILAPNHGQPVTALPYDAVGQTLWLVYDGVDMNPATVIPTGALISGSKLFLGGIGSTRGYVDGGAILNNDENNDFALGPAGAARTFVPGIWQFIGQFGDRAGTEYPFGLYRRVS